jgi:hypothetical protein
VNTPERFERTSQTSRSYEPGSLAGRPGRDTVRGPKLWSEIRVFGKCTEKVHFDGSAENHGLGLGDGQEVAREHSGLNVIRGLVYGLRRWRYVVTRKVILRGYERDAMN